MSSADVNANDCSSDRPLNPLKLIVDCDAGTDDALALILLLTAEARQCKCHQQIQILAISCVAGNTSVDNVCINVLRTLQAANRLDIPVYRGAEQPLISPDEAGADRWADPYHGRDGFGDTNLPIPDTSLLQTESAAPAINSIVASDKGQVSLLCLGPLTNIALALRTYPAFRQNLKDVWIMGGNYKGVGNKTSTAEYNFHFDPEAAEIVLSSMVRPVSLLPWETSLGAELPMDWRCNVFGQLNTPQARLLNAAERKVLRHQATWSISDALLAVALLEPGAVLRSRSCHMSVELCGFHTRGQAVLHHTSEKVNVLLIESMDCNKIKELLIAAGQATSFTTVSV